MSWFWEHPIMVTLQGWVDTTRALPFDPLWLSLLLFVAVLLKIRQMPKPRVEREYVRGRHYLGKLTPDSIRQIERGVKLRDLRKKRQKLKAERGAYLHGATRTHREETSDPPAVQRQSVLDRK